VESYIHRIGRTGRAGREGTAISLIQPFDRRKLTQIERQVGQKLYIRSLPSRSQIEARHLEKLQNQVLETLKGERLASFLPIVSQLSEEYEPHAIAAAALQMAYDKIRPISALSEKDDELDAVDEEFYKQTSTPKPKLRKTSSSSSKQK